jgi:recombination protein U
MGYWQSRGLRGSALEEVINATNDLYREKGLGIVQKIPTPIKPITLDKGKGVITLAYFEQKSTVDYIGVIQGIPICFDAKETTQASLPIANIHAHQIAFMEDFKKQGGEAFLVVYFKRYEKYFLLSIETLLPYYQAALKGGRKSIPYKDFEEFWTISLEKGLYLHYIETLNRHLQEKSKKNE